MSGLGNPERDGRRRLVARRSDNAPLSLPPPPGAANAAGGRPAAPESRKRFGNLDREATAVLPVSAIKDDANAVLRISFSNCVRFGPKPQLCTRREAIECLETHAVVDAKEEGA